MPREDNITVLYVANTVNTICFAVDVEITGLVDFYCLMLTTKLLLHTRIVTILLYKLKNSYILLLENKNRLQEIYFTFILWVILVHML